MGLLQTLTFGQSMEKNRKLRNYLMIVFLLMGVSLIIGIIIGIFGFQGRPNDPSDKFLTENDSSEPDLKDSHPREMEDENPAQGLVLMNSISANNIENYLRENSREPNIAGTQTSQEKAKKLYSHWKKSSLDSVKMLSYKVLLSYPDRTNQSGVTLQNENGSVLFESYSKFEDNDTYPAFMAYSASGVVEGQYVYVNYGSPEDYFWLKLSGANLNGTIHVARNGKVFRGNKVQVAEEHGAIGMILYSEPVNFGGNESDGTVWSSPPDAIQRGYIYTTTGDVLTPDYPATENAYRISSSEANPRLPNIPVYPVSAEIAAQLLGYLDGPEVPPQWRGQLNITYRIQNSPTANRTLMLKVAMKNMIKKIYDVFGILKGSREPDRYVLVGNHRDAWTDGAIDPVSGTATMVEISRVMTDAVREGIWRPKRTIIFCSWGAEEYGLVGSTEFVEEYLNALKERTVAYLNIDMAVTGQHMVRVAGTPLMQRVVDMAMKRVENPNPTEPFMNLFEQTQHRDPLSNQTIGIRTPGAGSDYAPFIFKSGIPSVDYLFISDKSNVVAFPSYHTKYDTFQQVKKFVDPTFKYHKAIGQLLMESARILSDSLIIPFNVSDYAVVLESFVHSMDAVYGNALAYFGVKLDPLKEAVTKLVDCAKLFQRKLQNPEVRKNPYHLRTVNDQLMQFVRTFLKSDVSGGQRGYKHLVFSPLPSNSYLGSGFARIFLAIDGLMFDNSKKTKNALLEQLSFVIFSLRSAASVLRDPIDFIENRDG